MSDDAYHVGLYSESPFIVEVMKRHFSGQRTIDGRICAVSPYSREGKWDALLLDPKKPMHEPPILQPGFVAIVLLPPRPFSYELRPEWENLPRYRLGSKVRELFRQLPIAQPEPSPSLSNAQLLWSAMVVLLVLASVFYTVLR